MSSDITNGDYTSKVPVFIYGLVDPFTYGIRYVGKANNPKKRLWSHCIDQAVTYRTNWIKKVLRRGGRPRMVILQEVRAGGNWKQVEKKWIERGRKLGWPLTNCTSGGDGVPNLPIEIRQKMASTWKGRKHLPESIEKIRRALQGRHHTEEHKEYMRRIMTGRKFTKVWRKRISKSVRKLSDEQIREVRWLLKEGKTLQKAIADKFGVHRTTIQNISNGTFYQDVV